MPVISATDVTKMMSQTSEICKLQRELEITKDALTESENCVRELKEELASQSKRAKILERNLDTSVTNHNACQETIAGLERRLTNLKTRHLEKTEEVRVLHREKAGLESERTKLADEVHDKGLHISELVGQKMTLADKLAALEYGLSKDHPSQSLERRMELADAAARVQTELAKTTERLGVVGTKLEASQTENSDLKAAAENDQAKIKRLEKSVDLWTGDASRYAKNVDYWRERALALEERITDKESCPSAALDMSRARVRKLLEKVDDQELQLGVVRRKEAKLKTECQELKTERQKLTDKVSYMGQTLKEYRSGDPASTRAREGLEKRIEILEQCLQRARDRIKRQEAVEDSYEVQITELLEAKEAKEADPLSTWSPETVKAILDEKGVLAMRVENLNEQIAALHDQIAKDRDGQWELRQEGIAAHERALTELRTLAAKRLEDVRKAEAKAEERIKSVKCDLRDAKRYGEMMERIKFGPDGLDAGLKEVLEELDRHESQARSLSRLNEGLRKELDAANLRIEALHELEGLPKVIECVGDGGEVIFLNPAHVISAKPQHVYTQTAGHRWVTDLCLTDGRKLAIVKPLPTKLLTLLNAQYPPTDEHYPKSPE